jgi:3-hydroxyacyl-CoA dehydrogenase/3-hydroxy-2-methylbutyryl-CoA dehydrogenase
VEGVSKWIQETGKPIGGIVSAAGVGNPGKVCPETSKILFDC